MKVYLQVIALLFLVSCNEDNSSIDLSLESQSLVGTWQMNGYKISAGGPLPDEFTKIDKGEYFVFDLDGTYVLKTDAQGSVQHSGVFEVIEEELILLPSASDVDEFRFSMDFNGDVMVLAPTAPYICIEGCLYRYQRLD